MGMGGTSPALAPEGGVTEPQGVLIAGNGSGSGMRVNAWCRGRCWGYAGRRRAVHRGWSGAARGGTWRDSCAALRGSGASVSAAARAHGASLTSVRRKRGSRFDHGFLGPRFEAFGLLLHQRPDPVSVEVDLGGIDPEDGLHFSHGQFTQDGEIKDLKLLRRNLLLYALDGGVEELLLPFSPPHGMGFETGRVRNTGDGVRAAGAVANPRRR